MARKINPTQLSLDDRDSLFSFFKMANTTSLSVWEKDTEFTLIDGSSFTFTHSILKNISNEGVRFDIISNNTIGEGYTGTVHEFDGWLFLGDGRVIFRLYEANEESQLNIVKIQNHSEKSHPLANAQFEYDMLTRAGHLNAKPPVFMGMTSYLVMKKIPGIRLIDVLLDELHGMQRLSLNERFKLTQSLLFALKKQVTGRGILHRDIKGENIMLAIQDGSLSVTIFDYGIATSIEHPGKPIPGTRCYAPPELLEGGDNQTPKVDVYGMARVLAFLWHVDIKSYQAFDEVTTLKLAKQVDLSTLFTGIDGLTQHQQGLIHDTLELMLKGDAQDRCSIDEAILAFSRLTSPFKTTALSRSLPFFRYTSSDCKEQKQIAKLFSHHTI